MKRTPIIFLFAAVLAFFAPRSFAQVSVCSGGGWTTGSTHAAGTGSDRLLVVAVGGESSAQGVNSFSAVSYGGQAMTRFMAIETNNAGYSFVATLWHLDEAGIAAASNSTISLTFGGLGFVDVGISAVTYCNVSQTAPIGSTATNLSEGPIVDPISVSIPIAAGNAGLAAAGCGNLSPFIWRQDVILRTNVLGTSSAWSTADMVNYASTATRTATADFQNNVNRNVILFAEINEVSSIPVANFSGTPTMGVRPLAVNFLDASTGAVTNRAWTFGDGGTSAVQNPVHTYNSAGTYTVSLTASGPGGTDTHTEIDYITVAEPPPTAAFTGTPTSGDAPLTVSFSDASGGIVTNWNWDFGDLGTSADQNPSHTYDAAGTYTVSLTVSGPGGMDTLTRTNYIMVVEPAPVAGFSGMPTSGNVPLVVAFTDSSSGNVTSRSWDFGDLGTSADQNPSHTYNAAGTYTVSLTATGPGGTDTLTRDNYITVSTSAVTANFTGTPTSGNAPLSVAFSDSSVGPVTSWNWVFGDTNGSSLPSPSNTYFNPGTYTVSLTVTGSAGSATDTFERTDYILVTEPAPVAGFSGMPTSGTAPLTVDFTDSSTGNVTSRSWTFGDGGMSALQDPSHTYNAAGTYTVSLTATGPGGTDTHTETDYITVSSSAVTANFTGSPTSGPAPLIVAFTDSSVGPVTSWTWTFGDTGGSTLQHPSNAYINPGTFTVSLTATGPGGTDTLTRDNYIVVTEPAPVAGFSGMPTSGNVPLTVDFTDSSSGNVTSRSWTFGDGGMSALQDPSHTYNAAGTFTVSLTATGPGGTDTHTETDYITVSSSTVTANFTGSPTSGPAPLIVTFTDSSVGPVSSWMWSFGDTNGSTLPNPVYTYAAAGTYTVSLTVSGPGGMDTLTLPDYIVVTEPAPVAGFSGMPTSGNVPLTVDFTDSSTGNVTSRSWTFGDGGMSALQDPSHTYNAAGTFTVSLTATGPGGTDTHTETDYITVSSSAVTANFTGSPTSGPAPLIVAFTDSSVGPVTSWTWTFGDTGGSTLQHPSNAYINPGTFTVSLTATGPGGTDTLTRDNYIVVGGGTQADFSGTPLSGTPPLTVVFTDATLPAATSWSWDFGDLGTSADQNPSHTYNAAGTFTVSLTATGPGGVDTETKPDYVVVGDPGSSIFRNGSGINPTCYSAPPPILGTTWTAEVDSSAFPGALFSVIFIRLAGNPGTNTTFGELLVDPTAFLANSIRAATGGVVLHNFPVPNDPSLLGIPGFTQGFLSGSQGAGLFCNAADLLPGFAPQFSPPNSAFSATPTTGSAPLTVFFTDSSTGNVTSRSWTFGDGGTSTEQNPTHVYMSSGNFSVSLVVEGPGGFDAEFKFEHVTVDVPLVADFTATPLSGVEPLNVVFSDMSTGSPTSWTWDFGDLGTSILPNPSHSYAAGTYTVTLTVTNSVDSGFETKTDYITVGNTPPVAEFSGTPLSGDAPLSVTFTDLSTGVVTGWFWTFGDGGASNQPNPTHNYTIAGIYTVILTATGPGGDGMETKPNYITVNVPAAPSANFIGDPLIGPQPLEVVFTDLSQGAVTAWAWDFEIGGTSSDQHPTIIFPIFGTYTVTLTATGPGGTDTEPKPDYVMVLPPPPIADFNAIPTSGIVPLTVFFSDASAGVMVSSWSWDFGDSGTSIVPKPSHTYDVPGTYTVSLTATNAGGSGTETKLDFISVEALPFGDGSFELQTAGLPPDLPWIVTSGSGHVIQPGSGPTTDNGMPVEGAQWALVSAIGTNAATPPSNPGGASFPPVGAAGFAQSFAFDPDNPVLVFNAAFILFGPQASTTMNDFMSVDVTNGVGAFNLYYADTFSAFPNTSTRFGLPMTDVEAVGVHLATLFPNAVAGDTITLAIQTGNGGDATLSSMGYVDDIFLRNEAHATYRNGRGINPPCYIADPPILGALWTAQIDHRDQPTASFVVILIRRDQVLNGPNTMFGEVLVGGATVMDIPAVANPGGITTVSFPVPLNLSLMGLGASQGLIVGQTFCNAVDFELGFQPTAPIPAADFSATPTMGPVPLAVSFTDLTTGPVTSWNWNFGDGAVSTLASPTKLYTIPGTYTVFLRVSGPGGLDIERKFDLVQAQ